MTCLASHLTSIGVEQYAEEKKSTTSTAEDLKTSSSASDEKKKAVEVINMWSCWAIYASFVCVGIMLIGPLWTRRKDANDELNLARIQKEQSRIYVNLFLEPIAEVRKKEPAKQVRNPNESYEKVNAPAGGEKQTPAAPTPPAP